MTTFVLLLILYDGFDPVGQTQLDGFSTNKDCEQAAARVTQAYESMSGIISTEFRCVQIEK